ncbi:MAG: autoinducer binding domain-containing protein [Pseudomonadota bacterium]
MATKLETYLETLQSTTTRQDLQTCVEGLRDVYDVQHVVYHAVNLAGSPYAALTYTQEWTDYYYQNSFHRVDPVVQGALRHFHPMDWKRLDWSTPASRQFYSEARDGGVGTQGLSIPIRGPNGQFALFTINQSESDDTWQHFVNDYVRDMLLIAHYVHQQVLSVENVAEKIPNSDLSPRERDALSMLGLGRNRAKIAEALEISEHTLRVYIDSARHKLGALNTTHAVALALTRGLIAM